MKLSHLLKAIITAGILLPCVSHAQGVGINTSGSAADSHAMLDISSATKGFLPPRLSAAQRTTLAGSLGTGEAGMVVADATTGDLYYWSGSAWGINAIPYTGTAPINVASNTVSLNSGTSTGDLITWNGTNWINSQPAVQHFTTLPLDNTQPYLVLNYCIAWEGIYPSSSEDEPYLGEINILGFNFVPYGYFACDGSLQLISTYSALYSLLGTTYGGDGTTTFAMPDLRGRVPIHKGSGTGLTPRVIGSTGGAETFTIVR